MDRKSVVKRAFVLSLVAISLLGISGASSSLAEAAETNKPKVIVVGFDGVDAQLTQQFMDEGLLPNLKKLADRGSFSPLDTTNPAQSPVAWGSIVTGLNPGKTNLAGFIRRTCDQIVMPCLATIEDSYQGDPHTRSYSDYSWLNQGNKMLVLGGGALAALVLGFIIVFILLGALKRLRLPLGLVVGVLLAACVVYFGAGYFDEIPEDVPYPFNLHQGDFFWNVLAENGIKCTGLYAPGAYPCDCEEGARILGGLGVPDVAGDTGTWYIYTDDEWVIRDQDTRTGGKVVKLLKRGGLIRGVLYGPKNFVQEQYFKSQLDQLEGDALRKLEREYRLWRNDNKKKNAVVDFTVEPDRNAGKAKITVAEQTQTISVGEWSDWFRVTFEISSAVEIPAIVRMRMVKCDDELIRIFVPAIDISPESRPGFLRISSPEDYADQLSQEVGLYETVGWSCITHGLKDQELSEEVFLEDIEYTMDLREKLLKSQLDSKDFDTILAVFYSPDRVQHMMYRLFDPDHPLHDSADAERMTTFFGKEIKLKDAVLESYKQVDRIVGDVVGRLDSGEFGDDATLMVVSDHGFAPYYFGMNLNNFLVEKGYMKLKDKQSGEPVEFGDIRDLRESDYLDMVDWENTQAYSLGLGKVFVNLENREPEGVVKLSEYESLRDRIIKDLESYIDPNNGRPVVKKAFKREEIFTGDFWKEGEAEFTFNRTEKETRKTDGFADIFLGFHRGYRVAWNTTAGGLDEAVIVQNDQKWSGDHVSVMPDDVKGVFFSNRKLKDGAGPLGVVDIVPTIYSLYGITIPEELDGRAVDL